MSLRVMAAAFVAALVLCGPGVAQSAEPVSAVRQLRNIAAADAAKALKKFFETMPSVVIAAEPVSNNIVVAGNPVQVQQAADLLDELDKARPTVLTQMIVLEAPVGFIETIGLGEEAETNWVLTPREARMLLAAVQAGKVRHEVEILTRPCLASPDNSTASFQVGFTEPTSVIAHVTPRITGASGTILLRVETEIKRTTRKELEAEKHQTTGTIPHGGTLVMRGARTKTANGPMRETLVIATANVMAPEKR